MRKQKTTEEFIVEAINVHGNIYNYSLVNYINSHTKVCIICSKHGIFWQYPNNHLSGCGCKKCGDEKISIKNRNEWNVFIDKSIKKYNGFYDYSLVNYITQFDEVIIICPKHGKFLQKPKHHLIYSGCNGCKKEQRELKKKLGKPKFVNIANELHGDFYDYSVSDFINLNTKIEIKCPIHGIFTQLPSNHINKNRKQGCPHCSKNYNYTTEEWINIVKKKQIVEYDYSETEYVNAKTKVKIICKKHGLFEQTADAHMQGHGCPKCKQSKLERQIWLLLNNNNINYEHQKTFQWLKNKENNHNLYLDFYLPEYDIAIECQGEQHFKPVIRFGGNVGFSKTIYRDNLKYDLCKQNNIKIIYFSNVEIEDFIDKVYNNEIELLNLIKNNKLVYL